MLTAWQEAEIIDIQPEVAGTKRFFLRLPEVETLDFRPGQFMTFDLPIHEKRNRRWRSYSIASAPNGTNVLEFVIVLLEGGLGTEYLFNQASIGTRFPVRGPQGHFTLPESIEKEICFICTGTGIAPFRSMLQHIYQNNIPHKGLQLVFGTRLQENILYYNEMKELDQKMPDFTYHVALSREKNPDWTGYKGYVHQIYENLYADKRDAHFYICGWQNMIDEACQRLHAMGYQRKINIICESYG
ncbi:MAG TPA: FAD-binding oxidoreductase [Chitinophagales bacterium]|nr:FAD-binding oxidoreductase [Chitinophagales bacterium]HRK25654.1 FAD-binding oxidoreductase [Chitinophagales bacterium]